MMYFPIELHWSEWNKLDLPDGMEIWDPDGFRGRLPEVVNFNQFITARNICTLGPRGERGRIETNTDAIIADLYGRIAKLEEELIAALDDVAWNEGIIKDYRDENDDLRDRLDRVMDAVGA
jgi:hypothetical protein